MHRRRGIVLGAVCAVFTLWVAPAFAGSDDEQLARMKDPDQWPSFGRDFSLTRHSDLKDINTSNINKLNMIWSQSLNALRGQEGQPLVIKDVGGKPVMFMVSGCPTMANCNWVQALDLSDPDNPKEIWNYVKKTDRDESAVPRACCDTVNRGASFADGKLVFATLDGYLIALDGQTGKEMWATKYAYPEHGETVTSAPLIADDKVIAGFGGDEFAARGRITAFDLKTGKEVWVCHSTGSDKDVCLTADTNKAHPEYGTAGSDIGISSYPPDEWKIGGGSPWAWYSYDPELKMVYYSTGNPGHWSPGLRCSYTGADHTFEKCNDGKYDNKWSMTIFGRKIDNGEAVFAYQMTPFDQWDYDGVNENMLSDMEIDGKKHKTLVHFDRNGFNYVLDRTDGTLLRANKYVTVDWAEKVDLKTGRPVKVKAHSPFDIGVNTPACPSAMGGKDQQPASFDPKDPTKFYVPTNNWCMEDEPQERSHTTQGTVYVFANVYMYPEKPGTTGKVKKFDVVNGKEEWAIPDPYPNWGGTMNTDGGLMFYGSLGGDFRAVDRNSGKVLWSRKLESGIIGNPITWKVGGKQYVGVYSGIGGWIGLPVTAGLDLNDKFGAIGATAMAKSSGLNLIPQGGTFYAFRVSSD